MLFFYIIIALLILSLTGISVLYLSCRKKSSEAYLMQQNNIALLRMQNIRARMSPHFFFNALSGISTETGHPENIKKDLKTLAMLLRRSIENIEQIAIPVMEELEVVKGYIDLQRWRVPEPFNFKYDILQGTNMNQLVPAMIIQIPVENAIKHGLMPLTGEKLLSIKIGNYDGGLQITIEDNGIGYSASGNRAIGTGTGLKILFQTISLLNSKNTLKIAFTVNDIKSDIESERGTKVEIMVPTNYSFDILHTVTG